MTAKRGQSYRQTKAEMEEAVKAVLDHGNISAAAKATGVNRRTLQGRLDNAAAAGLTKPRTQANPSRWRPGVEIVAARKAEFERYRASMGKDGNIIHLPDGGPFMVVALGDPHLDASGCDLDLWEQWIGILNRGKRITGISLGDCLDNWVKPLAHLYATAETPAPEGWILLEHYLEQIGEHLDASIAGNHDLWSGHSDVLGMLMRQQGVMHASNELRWAYRTPAGRDVTVKARHGWAGRSMYNEAHGIKRAAKMGQRDNILLGGHLHTSGDVKDKCPLTGKVTFGYQVGSFKVVDSYGVDLGLPDAQLSPAVALVIDPRRADTDPELVKHFYDPNEAADFLAMKRRKAAKKVEASAV
jgi:hypothetical protein